MSSGESLSTGEGGERSEPGEVYRTKLFYLFKFRFSPASILI